MINKNITGFEITHQRKLSKSDYIKVGSYPMQVKFMCGTDAFCFAVFFAYKKDFDGAVNHLLLDSKQFILNLVDQRIKENLK
jgi:hypothetical protein